MGSAAGELVSMKLTDTGGRLSGKVDFPQSNDSFTVVGSYDAATGKFSLVQDGNSGGLNASGSVTTRMKGSIKKSAGAAAAAFAAKKR